MYCSTCGKTVNQGLSYCNHCGASLSGAKENDAVKIPAASFYFLVAALVLIPIVGLGIIMSMLIVMKEHGFSDPMIFTISLMSFLLLLTSELVLARILMSSLRVSSPSKKIPKLSENYAAPLKAATIKGLYTGQHFEPVSSIVDNTTRHLEPVYREPTTGEI